MHHFAKKNVFLFSKAKPFNTNNKNTQKKNYRKTPNINYKFLCLKDSLWTTRTANALFFSCGVLTRPVLQAWGLAPHEEQLYICCCTCCETNDLAKRRMQLGWLSWQRLSAVAMGGCWVGRCSFFQKRNVKLPLDLELCQLSFFKLHVCCHNTLSQHFVIFIHMKISPLVISMVIPRTTLWKTHCEPLALLTHSFSHVGFWLGLYFSRIILGRCWQECHPCHFYLLGISKISGRHNLVLKDHLRCWMVMGLWYTTTEPWLYLPTVELLLELSMQFAWRLEVSQDIKLSRTALLSIKTTSWDPATSLDQAL